MDIPFSVSVFVANDGNKWVAVNENGAHLTFNLAQSQLLVEWLLEAIAHIEETNQTNN